MPFISIPTLVATSLFKTFLDKGKDFLVDKGLGKIWDFLALNKTTFENELTTVINDTMVDYQSQFQIEISSEKIEFYQSQTLIEELLKYSFINEIDEKKIQNAIDEDRRIIKPSNDEVENFITLFRSKIKSNPKLKALYNEENYKQEIFNISEKLNVFTSKIENKIQNLQDSIKSINNPQLILEWNKQLDEINEDYKSLKHITALKRVKELRKRMDDSGLTDNTIKAKATFLQALCAKRYFNFNDNDKVLSTSKLYIQAFSLLPTSLEYKQNAALGYFNLGDSEKASQLANQILSNDEFNLSAWVVRCYNSTGNVSEYIDRSVPQIIQSDKAFQLNIAYSFFARNQFNELIDVLQNRSDFLTIRADEPDRISHNNLPYWSIWSTLAIFYYFSQKKEFDIFSIKKDAYDNIQLTRIKSVIKKILDAVQNTEIENDFLYFRFEYHYMNLLERFNESDLECLEQIYSNIKNFDFNYHILFQLVRALASSNKDERMERAMEIISPLTSDKSELIIVFKINYYLKKNDNKQVVELIELYHSSIEQIDELNVSNILQLFNIHLGISKDDAIQQLKKTVDEKRTSFTPLKDLLLLHIFMSESDNNSESIKADIDKLASDFVEQESYLKNCVSKLYIEAKYYHDAAYYLTGYINHNVFDKSLYLYCKTLFEIPGKRTELQQILTGLRLKNINMPYELIQMDLTMAQFQNDYIKIAEICRLALQYSPDNSILFYNLMLSLHRLKDETGIKESLPLLDTIDFSVCDIATLINMAEILFKNEQQAALEFIFPFASNKGNSQIRQYYATKLLSTPNILPPISGAKIGDTIEYSIDGKIFTDEITTENIDTPPIKLLLGKDVGYGIDHNSQPLKKYHIKINKISNRYQVLLSSILKEIENPLSEINIQQFFTDQNSPLSSVEQFIQQLVENYGVQEELRRQKIEKTLEQYYRNEIPFSNLSKSVFNGNSVDAYLHVTSIHASAFRIPPAFLYEKLQLFDSDQYILDIPTIVLLYQLENEHDIKIPETSFIVSETTFLVLENILEEVKTHRNSPGSIQVGVNGIRNIIYEDDYHDKRIGFYEKLIEWINCNCNIVKVPECIEFIPKIDTHLISDIFFQSILDNFILAKREKCHLVTSDTIYFQLHPSAHQVLSIEILLRHRLSPVEYKTIRKVLLQKNVVGIALDDQLLQELFIDRQVGNGRTYTTSLLNLEIEWNKEVNIAAAVSHIRWIMLNTIISSANQLRYVEEIFSAMLPGLQNNKTAGDILQRELKGQFSLLGSDISNAVSYCLANALRHLRMID